MTSTEKVIKKYEKHTTEFDTLSEETTNFAMAIMAKNAVSQIMLPISGDKVVLAMFMEFLDLEFEQCGYEIVKKKEGGN